MKNFINLFITIQILSILTACKSDKENNVSSIKLLPVRIGDVYEYIDNEGKIVIEPQFREATIFRGGYALASDGDGLEYILENGKYDLRWRNRQRYLNATVFSEDGLAWVVEVDSPPKAISLRGDVQFTLKDARQAKLYYEGLAAFSIYDNGSEKWGFVDKKGKVAITPQFNNTGRFSDGKCAVENIDGKWGFIDKNGRLIINYQFSKIGERFIRNKAVVYVDQNAGVINESGKFVINTQFSSMSKDGDNYIVEQNKKWGWCDSNGTIIINPQFDYALPFMGSDLAPVQSGNKFGYINSQGKIIINPQFSAALPFNGKLAIVGINNKIGFIDKEGKYVIKPQFDGISEDISVYMLNGSSQYESVETDLHSNNINQTSTNQENKANDNTSNGEFTVITDKCYFYSEPNFEKQKTIYLIKDQSGIFSEDINGFVLATFENSKGIITKGWLNKNDIEIHK